MRKILVAGLYAQLDVTKIGIMQNHLNLTNKIYDDQVMLVFM